MSSVSMRALREGEDEERPPLPPEARFTDSQLQELQHYVGFQQTDGFIRFDYTDSGGVDLRCGADFSIPYDTYTPEEQKWVDEEDERATALRDTGWVAQLTIGWPSHDCPLDVEGGEHFIGVGGTIEAAVKDLYHKVRTGKSAAHQCRREEQRENTHAAIRRAMDLYQAGKLPEDEFASLEAAILAATRGHWRFNKQTAQPPTTEQAIAAIMAEHPTVREVIDLRPPEEE